MNVVIAGVAVVEAALLGLLYVGYRRENTPAVVNTAVATLLTLVPAAVAWLFGVDGDGSTALPLLTLVIGVAGVLHGIGMLGHYDTVWWWDHLTHTLSAALAAALLYAGLLVGGVPEPAAAAGTVFGLVTFGVLWEVAELVAREVAARYEIEPVLVHYGWRDTALDLVFDVLGAALIVALDVRLFVPTLEAIGRAAGLV